MTEPFIFANGQVANNVEDLIILCQKFPNDSLNYLMREDFEKWLSYIGVTKIAEYAKEARQASVADTEKLDLFIAKSQAKPKVEATPAPAKVEPKPTFNLFTAIAKFFSKNNTTRDNKSLNT